MKCKDLSNRQFGNWSVLYLEADRTRHGKARWRCRCTCGTERAVIAGELVQHKSLSCGCVDSAKLASGEASMRQVHTMYKYHARARGYVWRLSEQEVRDYILQNCYYCGAAPSNKRIGTRHNGAAIYNGIDRVDNTDGYTKENCVPCCRLCNQAKRNYTKQEFLDWAARIAAHQALKGD